MASLLARVRCNRCVDTLTVAGVATAALIMVYTVGMWAKRFMETESTDTAAASIILGPVGASVIALLMYAALRVRARRMALAAQQGVRLGEVAMVGESDSETRSLMNSAYEDG